MRTAYLPPPLLTPHKLVSQPPSYYSFSKSIIVPYSFTPTASSALLFFKDLFESNNWHSLLSYFKALSLISTNYTVLLVFLPTWYLQYCLCWFPIFHSYLLNGVLCHSSCFCLCSSIWQIKLTEGRDSLLRLLLPQLGQRMAHWIEQFQGPRLGPVCYQVNPALSIPMSLPGAKLPHTHLFLIKRSSWSLAPSISGCW